MKTTVALLLLLGVAGGLHAQPMPTVDKNGTSVDGSAHPVGSPSEYQASKLVKSGVAHAELSYGKVPVPSYVQNYEPNVYSAPYPPATCHGHAHGYYGNPAHECKIFHICQEDGRLETFDCPPYTKFNNYLLVCDWPHKVDYNCDPAYKDEDYPVQSHNPAYPVDRSYVPSFMNLYPAKPVYNAPVYHHEKALYPVTPLLKSYPVNNYEGKPYYETEKPYAPVYDAYEKKAYHEKAYSPVYPQQEKYPAAYEKAEKYAPVYDAYEKKSYAPVYSQQDKYPAVYEKAEKYAPVYDSYEKKAYAPVYPQQDKYPAVHEKAEKYAPVYDSYEKKAYAPAYPQQDKYPAVYEKVEKYDVKPVYEQKPVYNVEKTVYPVIQKSLPSYPVEKAVYDKPVYPVEKYEKPVYPVEKTVYEKAFYPVEKAVYDKPVYPRYSEYVMEKSYPSKSYRIEKPLYPLEKSSYPVYPMEKPFYPFQEKPVYQAEKSYPLYEKALYPVEKPLYPVYPTEKPLYAEEIYPTVSSYPAYPLEKPDYRETPYLTTVYPHNEYDVAYPVKSALYKAYPKVPITVESYAAALKSYNDYVNRYEKPVYPVSSYHQYRSRLAAYLRSL